MATPDDARLNKIVEHLSLARQYRTSDVTGSLAKIRLFTDALLNLIGTTHHLPKRRDKANNETSQDYINRLIDKGAIQKAHADDWHTLRRLGNIGAHDDDYGRREPTAKDADIAIACATRVLNAYRKNPAVGAAESPRPRPVKPRGDGKESTRPAKQTRQRASQTATAKRRDKDRRQAPIPESARRNALVWSAAAIALIIAVVILTTSH